MNTAVKGSILLAANCVMLCAAAPRLAAAQTAPPLQPPPATPQGPLAPPPILAPGAQANTQQQLDLAEQKDSKRGLQFVHLHADVGASWVSLNALGDSNLLDGEADPSGIGLALGGGLGVRLLYLTAGVRFRYAPLSPFALWSVGLEGNLRIPRGAFEPYLLIGAGFSRAGSFQGLSAGGSQDADEAVSADLDSMTASGAHARLGGGFDYFVTPVFSTGVRLDAEVVYLTRAEISGAPAGSIYADKGSAWGVSVSGLASLGLHF